jgi:hypothetical protein
MHKLSEHELKSLKEQLGGDVRLYDQGSDEIPEKDSPLADARVPALEVLRKEAEPIISDATHSGSTVMLRKNTEVKNAKKAPRGRNSSSDFSIRFGPKNSDKGSKVAIVSSKSKKIVYEQG